MENDGNASFSDLFDNNVNRGWIITRNEKDKVKAAFCTEDEPDNLCLTDRTDWLVKPANITKGKPSTSNGPKNYQLYGTAMFFIADLQNCPAANNHFTCKNIPFVSVLISGTVVSLSKHYDKYSIDVDDSTSKITCLIKQDELSALQLDEEEKRRHTELAKSFRENPNDPVLKADLIMMRALKKLVKNVPSFEDLKLGDIVTIVGNLKQHNNRRYIFITSIEKQPEDSLFHNKHLERLLDLYANTYNLV